MAPEALLRPGEVSVNLAMANDAPLRFIGRIHTPWKTRAETPRQGSTDGPICRIEIFDPWIPALLGLDGFERVDVLYWLHLSRRDLILQSPKHDGTVTGTFALRSPVRPNPIGLARARLLGVEHGSVFVQGLDCLNLTPLIDLKPESCGFSPGA
jgi:tRNA-Thr(GGU) m(6)t(6)A37 methyltransferase TsaA